MNNTFLVKDVFKQINKIELEYNVNSISFFGIDAWPIIRQEIFLSSSNDAFGNNNSKLVLKIKKNLYNLTLMK